MKTVITVVATLVIAGLVVTGLVLFVGLDWGAEKAQKESKSAAASAMQALSFTQDVHDALGTPFTQGEVTVQASNLVLMGTSTMQLTLVVTGPKGTGKASCSLTRPQGEKIWNVNSGMFFPASGPPIPLKVRSGLGGPGLPGGKGGGRGAPAGLQTF